MGTHSTRIVTTPFTDQRPRTSGLHKKVQVSPQRHYGGAPQRVLPDHLHLAAELARIAHYTRRRKPTRIT